MRSAPIHGSEPRCIGTAGVSPFSPTIGLSTSAPGPWDLRPPFIRNNALKPYVRLRYRVRCVPPPRLGEEKDSPSCPGACSRQGRSISHIPPLSCRCILSTGKGISLLQNRFSPHMPSLYTPRATECRNWGFPPPYSAERVDPRLLPKSFIIHLPPHRRKEAVIPYLQILYSDTQPCAAFPKLSVERKQHPPGLLHRSSKNRITVVLNISGP